MQQNRLADVIMRIVRQVWAGFGWREHVSIDVSEGHPDMDYKEHVQTYNGFLVGTKWLAGLVIATLVLMAIFLL